MKTKTQIKTKAKKPTQTQVLEQMLLNGELVTASTIYQKTKKLCGVGSMNHHVIMRPLREKYNIVSEWIVDKNGNRYKRFWIKNLRKKK